MCQVLKVAKSGYYYWRKQKAIVDPEEKALCDLVMSIYEEHMGRYGYRRITAEIRRRGIKINGKHVLRIMKSMGLRARCPIRYKKTTNSNHQQPVSENILKQDFEVARQDQVWLSDITYIRTSEGWLYLAVVMDLFSRRILGWELRDYMSKELVIEAFRKTVSQYQITTDTIFHSDRGVQFTAEEFRSLLEELGFRQSMSGRGNCYDNAPMESFFHTLKNELVITRKYESKYLTRIAIFEYIELYYNKRRLHSSLKYKTPDEMYNINKIV
jgi:transposase InsO family protein